GNGHHRHGDIEDLLSADLVTEWSEYDSPQWADQVADGKTEHHGQKLPFGRQSLGEDGGHGDGEVAVDTEVVPLHEVSDDGSADSGLQLLRGYHVDVVDGQAGFVFSFVVKFYGAHELMPLVSFAVGDS